MASIRMARVNAELEKWISYIIRDMGNSVISNAFFNVAYVDCSKDLKNCKVGICFMNKNSNKEKVLEALTNSKGYIKKQLVNYIKIKNIPDLVFVEDDIEEKARVIDKLISEIKYSDNTTDNTNE